MISILIPTYNYNIFPLVFSLYEQVKALNIEYEIIGLDDASKKYHSENQKINDLAHCSYSILEKNIGRSAIRNLLAKKARFENLLFLDADVLPIHNDFISNYIPHINSNEKVIYGGIRYQEQRPEKDQILRWVYGKSREALTADVRNQNPYLAFLTLNFMIQKSVFELVSFNEEIPNLRHEDTLFSYELKKAGVPMLHIENPVCHNGLESSQVFLRKSEESLIGLDYLIKNRLIESEYVKLSVAYKKLEKYKLKGIYLAFYRTFKSGFLKNLLGKQPSLLIFDLFRLGYFCDLNTK